jgi:tRNA pseudouridine13 synthase
MRGARLDALPGLLGPEFRVGGLLKSRNEDFVVEELPLYDFSGEGDHVYLTLRRSGLTTFEIEAELRRIFELHDADIGSAGLKDRHAVATQTFSIYLPTLATEDCLARFRERSELSLEIVDVSRHGNRLKMGHLLGNRFRLRIRGAGDDALARARAGMAKLVTSGLPNYFGAQRFGGRGDNAERGLDALRGRRMPPKKRKLMVSALQSALFNEWLARRIEDGLYEEVLPGDVARTEFGGLFLVEDLAAERARFLSGEIDYTGPMFGTKGMRAADEAGAREASILAEHDLEPASFRGVKAPGARRRARLVPGEARVEDEEGDPVLVFTLPKGSYATELARELGIAVAPR